MAISYSGVDSQIGSGNKEGWNGVTNLNKVSCSSKELSGAFKIIQVK